MPPEPEAIRHAVVVLHQKGWGQRPIAKELGITRKRVRGIVASIREQRDHGHSALPKVPKRRDSVLDAHAAGIAELLDKHPDITAVRLHEELTKKGFDGGYTIVKERLRQLRPKPKKSPVERFETEPGVQGQQDWSPYEVPFTQTGPTRVQCFSLVLAYSRRQYIHFCERADLITLERQHIAAAERFGGLPEEILYDNQKAVVLRWEAHRPLYNPKFLCFASHYGFRPRAMPPRTPEWKGKVEAPFQYVEGNCLNARTLGTKRDLDELATWWMDNTSDLHTHDTTRQRPIDRFAEEADALLPLPAHPYDTAEVGYRVVSEEGLVAWEDVRYSVPFAHLCDVVVVRALEHELLIYAADLKTIAHHEKAPRGHREPVIDPAHRPAKKSRHDVDALCARMGELGEAASLFAAGVCKMQRYRGSHLADVLALVATYNADDLVLALERAVRYRAFDAGVVARILAAQATPRPLPSTEDEGARRRLREHSAALFVPPRALGDYAAALSDSTDNDDNDTEIS